MSEMSAGRDHAGSPACTHGAADHSNRDLGRSRAHLRRISSVSPAHLQRISTRLQRASEELRSADIGDDRAERPCEEQHDHRFDHLHRSRGRDEGEGCWTSVHGHVVR